MQAVVRNDDLIIGGVREEGGRRLRGDLLFVGESLDQLRRRVFPEKICPRAPVGGTAHRDNRIDEDHEIGPTAHPLDGIARLRVTGIEVSACGGGEMATG